MGNTVISIAVMLLSMLLTIPIDDDLRSSRALHVVVVVVTLL